MKSNIAIIGMVKRLNNEVASTLSDRLEMYYLDMDDFIQYEKCLSIPQIVEDNGEDYFLKLESKKLKSACEFDNTVIATAPSILLTYANSKIINDNCYVVVLKAENRSAARNQEKNFDEDDSLYLRYYLAESYTVISRNNSLIASRLADVVITIDDLSVDKIVDDIIRKFTISA